MPQMTFWARQVPSGISWTYAMDPVDPGRPGSLGVVVHDQSHRAIVRAGCLIPPTVLHECVASLIGTSWDTYLFGELEQLQPALSEHVARWRTYASAERRRPV